MEWPIIFFCMWLSFSTQEELVKSKEHYMDWQKENMAFIFLSLEIFHKVQKYND